MKRLSLQLSALSFAVGVAAMAAGCATRPLTPDFYGAPANGAVPQHTIQIGPNTRYANVENGQVIAFVANGKTFTWHFMAPIGRSTVRLNEIAPPDFLDHQVTVYLSPDPRYIGGDGHDGGQHH